MGLREEYRNKVEAQMREWDAKVEELKAKAEQAKAEAKIGYLEQIEALKAKGDVIKKNMEELKSSGEDVWESIKAKIDPALEEFKGVLDGIISKFK